MGKSLDPIPNEVMASGIRPGVGVLTKSREGEKNSLQHWHLLRMEFFIMANYLKEGLGIFQIDKHVKNMPFNSHE